MRLFTYTFLLALIMTHESFAQVEESIKLTTEVGDINGTLLIANESSTTPLAIIIAGSGPTDRDGNNPTMSNNSLKMVAEGLATKGISTLRYDKRGIASSTIIQKESALRFEDYIEDVSSWIQLLGQDARFKSISIIGHSEGSLIGMVAAQHERVAKYISIAGVAEPIGKTLRLQLEAQSTMLLEQSSPIIEALEKGQQVEEVPRMLYALFRPSVQPYLISWMRYDPSERLATLTIPTLIVQGTTDIQVSEKNAMLLQSANPDAKLVIIDGMNHILKLAPKDRMSNLLTYNQPDLPLAYGLIDALANFILRDN